MNEIHDMPSAKLEPIAPESIPSAREEFGTKEDDRFGRDCGPMATGGFDSHVQNSTDGAFNCAAPQRPVALGLFVSESMFVVAEVLVELGFDLSFASSCCTCDALRLQTLHVPCIKKVLGVFDELLSLVFECKRAKIDCLESLASHRPSISGIIFGVV